MKKIFYSVLALAAVAATSCNEARLDIPQKGVTSIESFYKTDADAESALTSAYAQFATYVTGRGNEFIYTPYKAMLNNGGDDFYAAGSNFGDNDYLPAINEYRFDSGSQVIGNFYNGLYLSQYANNLVIDNFTGNNSVVAQRCVAEARILRAYNTFLLTVLWGNAPLVDHVLAADALPYPQDIDPERPMSYTDLLEWVANECAEAVNYLDERKSTTDKDGAVKVTKGFAYALQGKTLLFLGDYAGAKTALKKVIDSGKYALVPGNRYWENFHIEGDANEEKVFESNNEYNAGLDAWSGPNQRSGWMESQIWGWRSDHFKAVPHAKYMGCDGWGGCGVPQWFGDEFFANDGPDSYRFNATLKHIDDVVYNMEYLDDDINKALAGMTLAQKQATDIVGINDLNDGLYGQSFWLPFKQLTKATDCNANYGNNLRLNNNVVMRYAEVLLLYAEACVQSGAANEALPYIKAIQERAGSKTISTSVDMNVVMKEKSYELWLEGSRLLDIKRWGKTDKIAAAGSDVPKLFDKVFRAPKAGEKVTWENGTEANSRFYTVSTHLAKDAGYTTGYQDKHKFFPFPIATIQKNPNFVQHAGF